MEAALKQQFDDMGIEPTAAVLDKSIELCISYRIEDAAEFVEQWMAFSISHLNDAEPTVDHLIEFERKVFQAKREKELLAASKKKAGKLPSALANLTHLNDIGSTSNPLAMYGVHDEDVMDDYIQDIVASGAVAAIDDTNSVVKSPIACHTPKTAYPPKRRNTIRKLPKKTHCC